MAVPHARAASCHLSHSYPDGACLYFTFAATPPADEVESTYVALWDAGQRAVLAGGGNLSHHHGVGLNRARFVAEALGAELTVLQAVKDALDPPGSSTPASSGCATRSRRWPGRCRREHRLARRPRRRLGGADRRRPVLVRGAVVRRQRRRLGRGHVAQPAGARRLLPRRGGRRMGPGPRPAARRTGIVTAVLHLCRRAGGVRADPSAARARRPLVRRVLQPHRRGLRRAARRDRRQHAAPPRPVPEVDRSQ